MCGFTSWPLCLSVESNPLHSLGSELGSGGCVCNIYHGTLDVGVWEASLSQYCVSPTSTDLGVHSCAGASEGETVDTRFLTLGSQPSERNVLMSQSYSLTGAGRDAVTLPPLPSTQLGLGSD